MKYIYETHLHTSQGSACGKCAGGDYIAAYKALGYDGIFVTDHFYHGNTAIDRSLPWETWVNEYCKGYEEAYSEGRKQGFKVFFGWEENFAGDEYLIYGLGKAWLVAHPEMRYWTREEQYRAVDSDGGAIIQAHPFRDRAYISKIHLNASLVHGAEVYNFANKPDEDAMAVRYARERGLLMTAGSDVHSLAMIRQENSVIAYDKPILSSRDYAGRIRRGDAPELVTPGESRDWHVGIEIALPIDIRDAGVRDTSFDELFKDKK